MSASNNGSYILVAMTWGDDSADSIGAGKRIWSQEFRTRHAAESCMTELKKWDDDIRITIFDDFEEN
jgi:hypothetical protein